MRSARYFCRMLTKFGFFWTGFNKSPHIEFHGNVSSGSNTDICEQTEEHKAADSRFSQLYERA